MDRVQLPPARVPAAAQEPTAPRDPFRGPARWGREVRPTSQTRVTRIRRYGYCLEASRMGAKDRDAAGQAVFAGREEAPWRANGRIGT